MELVDLERFTPIITTLITVVLGGLIVGAFAVWNRRRGAVESRVPDVMEMWSQTEKDRRLRRFFEDLYYETRGSFRGYVRRVRDGGSTELSEAEKIRHDLDPQIPKELQ